MSESRRARVSERLSGPEEVNGIEAQPLPAGYRLSNSGRVLIPSFETVAAQLQEAGKYEASDAEKTQVSDAVVELARTASWTDQTASGWRKVQRGFRWFGYTVLALSVYGLGSYKYQDGLDRGVIPIEETKPLRSIRGLHLLGGEAVDLAVDLGLHALRQEEEMDRAEENVRRRATIRAELEALKSDTTTLSAEQSKERERKIHLLESRLRTNTVFYESQLEETANKIENASLDNLLKPKRPTTP